MVKRVWLAVAAAAVAGLVGVTAAYGLSAAGAGRSSSVALSRAARLGGTARRSASPGGSSSAGGPSSAAGSGGGSVSGQAGLSRAVRIAGPDGGPASGGVDGAVDGSGSGGSGSGVGGSGVGGSGDGASGVRGSDVGPVGSADGSGAGVQAPAWTQASAQVSPARTEATSPAELMAKLGPIPAGWQASVHSLTVGGIERDYLVMEPADLGSAGPVPVVVLMHGRDESPDTLLHQTGVAQALASTGPAVLVAPAGWQESWDAGGCCGLAYERGIDDVTFVHDVVEQVLSSTPAADPSQVFAVGFSNGGRMAYRLACDLPGTFSAFMAVEAVPVDSCPSMAHLGVTIVAQEGDPLLTVGSGPPKVIDGYDEPTVDATVAHLAALDGCDTAPVTTTLGQAVEQTWACAGGHDLRYVLYPGGAHDWRKAAPGGSAADGGSTAATPGATDFVLQLLGRGVGSPAL